jgi:hypothetical protein
MRKKVMQMTLDALNEAIVYTCGPAWSPSMTNDCEAAINALTAALALPDAQPVAVTWESAMAAIDHVALHNSSERERQAVAMLVSTPQPVIAPEPPSGNVEPDLSGKAAVGRLFGVANKLSQPVIAPDRAICNLWIDPTNGNYVVDHCDHPPSECFPVYSKQVEQ